MKKGFELWSINFRPKEQRFSAEPAKWIAYSKSAKRIVYGKRRSLSGEWNLGRVAFTGDQAPLARRLLLEKINEDRKRLTRHKSLDMEPFEIVRDMLRDKNHSETIGGAPQIVKIYQYMRSVRIPAKADSRSGHDGQPRSEAT